MEVETVMRQGTWSEVSMTKGVTKVLGYTKVHDVEVKNQSRHSKSGERCLLV